MKRPSRRVYVLESSSFTAVFAFCISLPFRVDKCLPVVDPSEYTPRGYAVKVLPRKQSRASTIYPCRASTNEKSPAGQGVPTGL